MRRCLGLLLNDADTTETYTVPADGCASYRSLYERVSALELDTHVHIHKENHVLFPDALTLAEAGDSRLTRRTHDCDWPERR